jgi:hypothetical protein
MGALAVKNQALLDYREELLARDRVVTSKEQELLGGHSKLDIESSQLRAQQSILMLREQDLELRKGSLDKTVGECSAQLDARSKEMMDRVYGMVAILEQHFARAHMDNSGIQDIRRALMEEVQRVELQKLELLGQTQTLSVEKANVAAAQSMADTQMVLVSSLQRGLWMAYHHWQSMIQQLQQSGSSALEDRFRALHQMACVYAENQASESLKIEERRPMLLAFEQERIYLITNGAPQEAMQTLPAIGWHE